MEQIKPFDNDTYTSIENACACQPYFSAVIVLADGDDIAERVHKCFTNIVQRRGIKHVCTDAKFNQSCGLIFYDNGSRIRIGGQTELSKTRGFKYNAALVDKKITEPLPWLEPLIQDYKEMMK